MKKEKFIRRFRKHFLLRFHMSLILAATCLSGALFSKLLLLLPVRDPLIRYPLTACLSYLLFFLFVKLWLWYVSTSSRQKVADSADSVMETVDLTDIPMNIASRAVPQAAETLVGGGGHFGGGGASGSFGEAAFEFLLAGSLVKRSRKMDDPDWMRSVLNGTWVPFAAVFAISVAAGWVLHACYPEVARIADLLGR
jgi:hypothetical protein